MQQTIRHTDTAVFKLSRGEEIHVHVVGDGDVVEVALYGERGVPRMAVHPEGSSSITVGTAY